MQDAEVMKAFAKLFEEMQRQNAEKLAEMQRQVLRMRNEAEAKEAKLAATERILAEKAKEVSELKARSENPGPAAAAAAAPDPGQNPEPSEETEEAAAGEIDWEEVADLTDRVKQQRQSAAPPDEDDVIMSAAPAAQGPEQVTEQDTEPAAAAAAAEPQLSKFLSTLSQRIDKANAQLAAERETDRIKGKTEAERKRQVEISEMAARQKKQMKSETAQNAIDVNLQTQLKRNEARKKIFDLKEEAKNQSVIAAQNKLNRERQKRKLEAQIEKEKISKKGKSTTNYNPSYIFSSILPSWLKPTPEDPPDEGGALRNPFKGF